MESDLLFFQDDSASCSSSPIGEDIDDLRLGAEANMFSPRYSDNDVQEKRRPVHKFVIAKENSTTDGGDDLNYTYSTISSISDLLDAREGEPDEMLFRLGFASFEGEETHSSILSRFSSPIGHYDGKMHDQQMGQTERGAQIGSIAHDGIVKTQEWLNSQEDVSSSLQSSPAAAKDNAGCGGKVGDAAAASQQCQGKRLPAHKKRSKWSKSRQSSFELLLPNLEEEESVSNACEAENTIASMRDTQCECPTRDSSREKAEIPNLDRREMVEAQARSNITPISEKLSRLAMLDRSATIHERGCGGRKHLAASAKVDTDRSSIPVFVAMPLKFVDAVSSEETSTTLVLPLERSRIAATIKVDSFELEEIASNDGRLSPNLPKTMKRCANAVATRPISAVRNETEEDSVVGGTLSSRSSPSIASESSSGFHDGTEDSVASTYRQGSTGSAVDTGSDETHDATQRDASGSFLDPIPDEMDRHSWRKMVGFCPERSKMARISGTTERTTPEGLEMSICATASKSTSCLPMQQSTNRGRTASCPGCLQRGNNSCDSDGFPDNRLTGGDPSLSEFREIKWRPVGLVRSCRGEEDANGGARFRLQPVFPGLCRSASVPALATVTSAFSRRLESCANAYDDNSTNDPDFASLLLRRKSGACSADKAPRLAPPNGAEPPETSPGGGDHRRTDRATSVDCVSSKSLGGIDWSNV